jgi:hypothetical protein
MKVKVAISSHYHHHCHPLPTMKILLLKMISEFSLSLVEAYDQHWHCFAWQTDGEMGWELVYIISS